MDSRFKIDAKPSNQPSYIQKRSANIAKRKLTENRASEINFIFKAFLCEIHETNFLVVVACCSVGEVARSRIRL